MISDNPGFSEGGVSGAVHQRISGSVHGEVMVGDLAILEPAFSADGNVSASPQGVAFLRPDIFTLLGFFPVLIVDLSTPMTGTSMLLARTVGKAMPAKMEASNGFGGQGARWLFPSRLKPERTD